jgi:ABC-type multidrug transport system fused ATPase/permease subunit
LEKDAAFYDTKSPNEMSAKIAKEMTVLQRGIGEKLGQFIMSIFTFFFGFAFAFYWGWLYTAILCASLPVMAGMGIGMAMSFEGGMIQQMKAYAQSAGYAEQALQAIRVVHTYGQETLECTNYAKYLNRAKEI